MTGSLNERRQMLDYSKWDNISLSSDEESDAEEEGTSLVHPDSVLQTSAMTEAISRLARSVEARNYRLLDMTNAVCRAPYETPGIPMAACVRLTEIGQSFLQQPDVFVLINFNIVQKCVDAFQQQAIFMNRVIRATDVLIVFRPSTDQYFFMQEVTKMNQNAMDRWCATWFETICCICEANCRDDHELKMQNCRKCFAAVCSNCTKAHLDANGIPLPRCPLCRENFLHIVPAPNPEPAQENLELNE